MLFRQSEIGASSKVEVCHAHSRTPAGVLHGHAKALCPLCFSVRWAPHVHTCSGGLVVSLPSRSSGMRGAQLWLRLRVGSQGEHGLLMGYQRFAFSQILLQRRWAAHWFSVVRPF